MKLERKAQELKGNNRWKKLLSEAKSRYVIPEGGALIFRIVKDEGNTRRYEVDKNKPNHITFNVFDKEGLLYLVFADKALTGYALSLNYNSDTMEALDKGDLSKAVLCYTVEKGKPNG